MLPVEPGLGTSYGDGLATVEAANAQNEYNLTVIEPSFAINPWYANNPDDPDLQYETFMTSELEPWVKANLATTGTEQNWLLGFSKSGLGAQDLLLKHPGLFTLAASWDFPADMPNYAEFGTISTAEYGTDANYQANYRLTAAFLSTLQDAVYRQRPDLDRRIQQVPDRRVGLRLAAHLRRHRPHHRDTHVDGAPLGQRLGPARPVRARTGKPECALRRPGRLPGPVDLRRPAVTGPLAQRGLRVERGQHGLVGAGPEAGQQADLAGEGGPVVVDGVVLDEPIGDLHHVDAADVDLGARSG